MLKKDKWINNFKDLDPKDQLVVADAIKEELSFNEKVLDDDEYDKVQSENIAEFFNLIKSNIKNTSTLNNFKKLIKKYDGLSLDNKRKVMDEFLLILTKYSKIQEQEDKEKICLNEGHTFKNWKKITYTTKEVFWDAGPRGFIDVEHNVWKRTCSRCGLVETVDNEPQELIDERIEKNRKARIKRLEQKLAEAKKKIIE